MTNQMKIRWIMHKKDGSSIASGWNTDSCSWRKNWGEDITSVQLQTTDTRLHTLSAPIGEAGIFWQEDNYIAHMSFGTVPGQLVARTILQKVGNDMWLALTVDIGGNSKTKIVKRKIGTL